MVTYIIIIIIIIIIITTVFSEKNTLKIKATN
jgi:hypothetical protein